MFPATASLSFGDLGSVLLTLGEPWLVRGPGAHRLTFQLTSYASWLEGDTEAWTPMLLGGNVWIDLPAMQWLGSVEPQTLSVRGWQAGGDHLAVVLSDQQLFAIEAGRSPSDDLRLRLKLEATLLGTSSDVFPIRKLDVPASIQATQWRALLDQVGHGVGITLFIPSPLTDDGSPLTITDADERASYARLTQRLRQARDHVRNGDYEEAVAACRRVMEVLDQLASVPKESVVAAATPQRRTQAQRWAAIVHDLKRLASAAHHDDQTTAEFDWSRADAEAVLAITAGLVRRMTA